ncbi:response regulator [Sulfurimonas sp. MAG313]|nr:response regulator [Sulfurimonas sp. MAG313]MDF1879920.1 response regulator [Sulfurimonas sp. MAG313]
MASLFSWFSSKLKNQEPTASITASMEKDGFVSKELFYEILDLETNAILFFTKDEGWIGANKAFFNRFDFDNIADFRNKHESIRELFIEESEEVFTEYDKSWLDYIRIHKENGYRVVLIDKDEMEIPCRTKARKIRQAGKDLYVLELEDISELEEARYKTEEVERLKSKFLSNIGHEFRTPMNGILGFIELMEKNNADHQQSEYLQMINISARNLMSNIESLLDLAQMQGGRLKLNEAEFNPIAEMEELAKLHAVEGRNKGIHTYFYIDPKLPQYMTGDLRKLKQILNNLINNALKFTKRGGKVMVEIKLVHRNNDGTCTIGFGVKDTGKGILKEHLALITEPFVAGDQADNRLGVGLSLSHGLIKMMGGDLRIQSEVEKGSSFSFALRFACSDAQSFQVVQNCTAKVVLLDESRVEDANQLTMYLRSFSMNVVKVNQIDDKIYQETDLVYLVASQDKPGWRLSLSSLQKKGKTILVINPGEQVQTKMAHVIDHTFVKPMLPSKIANHLAKILRLPKSSPSLQETQDHDVELKALVVEDNLINQRLIKILLQEYNLKVSTAGDGEEAVNLCVNNEYNIVFMDIDMPVKDGILATQEIKQQRNPSMPHMPIVALTALAMEGDREHILEEGLDDYLSKPLTREKLEYVLHKHLRINV